MNLLKRVFLIILIVFLVFTGAAVLFTFLYGDKITSRILTELNKQIHTEIAVEEVSFSLLRKFPFATIEFKNIMALHAEGLSIGDFPATSSDTLFYLENLFLEFSPFDLLDNNIHMKQVQALNGRVNMLTDLAGNEGFIFWKSDTSSSSASTFTSSIDNIHIKNVSYTLDDLSNDVNIEIYINSTKLKGDFSGEKLDLETNGSIEFEHLYVNRRGFIVNKSMDIAGLLTIDGKIIHLRETIIQTLNQEFNTSGEIHLNTPRAIYLNFVGKEMEVDALLDLIPEEYQEYVYNYRGNGNISVLGSIEGDISGDNFPAISFNYHMDEATFTHKISKVTLANLFSEGSFYYSATRENLSINSISFDSEMGSMEGSVIIDHFQQPDITMKMKGHLQLEKVNAFFPNEVTEYLSGDIEFDAGTNFAIKGKKPFSPKNISISYLNGYTQLHEVYFKMYDKPFLYESINGKAILGNDIQLQNISFKIRDNDFLINGRAENAMAFLTGKNRYIWIEAKVHSNKIVVDNLLVNEVNTGKNNQAPLEINFPDRANLKLQFTVDNFYFKNFIANDAEGIVSYKPRMFIIKSLSFNGMEGRCTANGVISQNNNNDFLVKSQADLSNININQLFTQFNNFGQQTLRDDHLRGSLTGNLSFSSVWTNQLKAKMETVTTEAEIEIKNGELIEFEPMMGLSRFIELDELKHIRFAALQNHIFIRDRVITIPKMDIVSSALDITASGNHDFDNNFIYRMQLLLSDVLAGKAQRNKPRETEFGIVEEDGLGRTNVYLKIEGSIEDYAVSYDKAQMKEALKDDIKKEKQELRAIFNEEFGWFKNEENLESTEKSGESSEIKIDWKEDEFAEPKSERKKDKKSPAFKIQWEETDTSKY